MTAKHQRQQSYHLPQIAPHVNIRASVADGEVLIECVQRNEGSAHAENLQQGHTRYPLVADGDEDELVRDQCQSEHQREGEKGGEAEHLAKHLLFLAPVVFHRREHGLRYLPHRVGDKRIGLGVPVVSLRVVAHIVNRIETTEDKGQHIVAHSVDDIGDEQLHAEGEHLPHRSEVDMQLWPPACVIESAKIEHRNKNDLLPCEAPVGHAAEGEAHAHHIR